VSVFSGINLSSVWAFRFDIGNGANGDYTFYVDDIRFETNCAPANTVTASPTQAPTTPTATPTVAMGVCTKTFYDGEALATSLAGTYWWASPNAAPSGSTASDSAAAAHNGTTGLRVRFDWQDSGWWCGFYMNWANQVVGNAWDLSTATNLVFSIRAAAGSPAGLKVVLEDSIPTGSPGVLLTTYLPGGVTTSWSQVAIPMSAFTGINKSSVWAIRFDTFASANGDFSIDLDGMYFEKPGPAGPCP
jgi:hypothetical protein